MWHFSLAMHTCRFLISTFHFHLCLVVFLPLFRIFLTHMIYLPPAIVTSRLCTIIRVRLLIGRLNYLGWSLLYVLLLMQPHLTLFTISLSPLSLSFFSFPLSLTLPPSLSLCFPCSTIFLCSLPSLYLSSLFLLTFSPYLILFCLPSNAHFSTPLVLLSVEPQEHS